MDQLIKKILDTDRAATEQTLEALHRQADAHDTVQKKQQALREEYLGRAEKRLHTLEEKQAEIVQETLARFRDETRRQAEQLEQARQEHKEEWIKEVTRRALEGETSC